MAKHVQILAIWKGTNLDSHVILFLLWWFENAHDARTFNLEYISSEFTKPNVSLRYILCIFKSTWKETVLMQIIHVFQDD